MESLKFSLPEILSLLGVVQCVYILVYVLFRTIRITHVILPLLYFLVLGCAFLSDFAARFIAEIIPAFALVNWTLWNYVLPLGVLLIFQMARISKLPPLPVWGVLAFVPAALAASITISANESECRDYHMLCDTLRDALSISAIIAGALGLLVIWGARTLFSDIRNLESGRERYWLILSLILLNICFLGAGMLRLGGADVFFDNEAILLRTILGLTFCYIVSTSLFRIYPLPLVLAQERSKKPQESLNDGDHILIPRIDDLLDLQKVYHEPTYTRGDMARELGVSEATLSRIINLHYGKSFPQILNERRIQDAKRLLLETQESIKIIAQEVGFNSLPSFNRAFRDQEGRSPSDYRKYMVK